MIHDQAHMASLFENATEGIILTDDQGEIVLVNPAAERIFGYSAHELSGQKIEVLIPTRYQPTHHGLREGFYHNPQNRPMGAGRELFARRKDGKDIPVEVSLSHYRKLGRLFVIAFVIDITKRKEIESSVIEQKKELEKVTQQIRKMNAQLEAKVEERTQILKEALNQLEKSQKDLREALNKEKELNEIKSRFVSLASHEFRTPLSSVLSSASLLGKYTAGEDQDKRDKHIRRIKDSVKHLNDLLEDFLSLGKLEEGKVQVSSDHIHVKEFLEEVIEEIRTILKNGQTIQLHYTGVQIFVTDKKLLKNIMINLLGNASKFSDEGKPIDIICECGQEKLQITVKDKGIGISDEDQQHMFSSFFRGHNATNIQGTGLGLHIVRRYLDLLDGSVYLKSKLGEGTEISIILPPLI
jgi:PAS domain S-box-containing protein